MKLSNAAHFDALRVLETKTDLFLNIRRCIFSVTLLTVSVGLLLLLFALVLRGQFTLLVLES